MQHAPPPLGVSCRLPCGTTASRARAPGLGHLQKRPSRFKARGVRGSTLATLFLRRGLRGTGLVLAASHPVWGWPLCQLHPPYDFLPARTSSTQFTSSSPSPSLGEVTTKPNLSPSLRLASVLPFASSSAAGSDHSFPYSLYPVLLARPRCPAVAVD